MTIALLPEAHRPRTRTWTPRLAAQLTVLAASAFVYVTAELAPVGALPAIATDLRVGEAAVGALVASYALVAAVMTVPLVRWTAHWSRRRTLLVTLVTLTVAQTVSALSPDLWVLGAGRVSCALTHGLMWSVIAPIAVRLVPASHAGRATTAIYVGSALALVVGSPLTAALSQVWGWRPAFALIAVAAAAVTVAAWLLLPAMAGHGAPAIPARRRRLNLRLVTLCLLTAVGVSAHFISYTFIVVIIRDVVGVHGPALAWLLLLYGAAGLTAMGAMARPLDRRPRSAALVGLGGMAGAFLVLMLLALAGGAGPIVVVIGGMAVVLWGAMATALPPMLQSAAMRAAPEDPDAGSGWYVAAFQVGIMAGSLAGGFLYESAGIAGMIAASALLVGAASVGVITQRGLFQTPQATRSR